MKNPQNKNPNKHSWTDNLTVGMFIIVIITVLITFRFSTNYIQHYIELLQDGIEKRLFAECKVIQNRISVEQLNEYQTPSDMYRYDYISLRKELEDYANENGLMFIYLMRMVNGQIQYIIDSDSNPQTQYGLDHFEDPYDVVLKAFNGEKSYNLIGDYVEGWEGILSAYVPIFDANGNVVAVLGVDISDEEIVKRREETEKLTYISVALAFILGIGSVIFIIRYRKKAQAARDANLAKSQFLSRMSHEIRTPMNAIIGFCRMAKKTDDLVKKEEYIDNISTSSDYLLELINGILDISKIEASKMILSLDKMSPYKVMDNIHVILASQITKKEQTFNIDVAKDIPKYIFCDETKLTQIIVNLAANAIKFTPEKGNISIKASLLEKHEQTCNIEFIIEDNGIGIEEEALAKLFEPFEQADGSITRKFGGTGLGLTISKLFVEMMKGTIAVTSELGKGSKFIFNIKADIVPEAEYPNEEATTTNDETSGNEETIDCTGMAFLVAEDNEINQVIVKDILDGFKASVEFVGTGVECIAKFKENPNKYKIIFMDIQMPQMDGLEATRKIRASDIPNAKDIPIVAMTAEVFQEDINNALNAGMNAHLAKPLDVSEVVKVIKDVIKK